MNISQICSAVQNTFKVQLKAANIIPSILLICSLLKRPGLSTLSSTATIITNQAKFGAPTGKLPDGTENMMNGLINIIVDEVFRALREDANIQVAIPVGGVTVQVQGSSAAGPVICLGSNILPVSGHAVIQ